VRSLLAIATPILAGSRGCDHNPTAIIEEIKIMSTRAVYTFKDVRGTFHVYKHCDGYPEGAVGFIKAAFEIGSPSASDLAVSFIVANKRPDTPYSGSELTSHYDQHGDLEYRYEISSKKEEEAIFEVKKRNFIISAFERTSSVRGCITETAKLPSTLRFDHVNCGSQRKFFLGF
jgi:hypothetical protein